MFQYLHTDVAKDDSVYVKDDSVSTYWCCKRWLSIHIHMWQKMIQYLDTDVVDDDDDDDREEDSVFTYWYNSILMVKIPDSAPNIPMTYRDSTVRCRVMVVVASVVEYLPS